MTGWVDLFSLIFEFLCFYLEIPIACFAFSGVSVTFFSPPTSTLFRIVKNGEVIVESTTVVITVYEGLARMSFTALSLYEKGQVTVASVESLSTVREITE